MSWVAAFGRFWWDFVVGDDWLSAVGISLALGATAGVAAVGIAAWWLLPVGVVCVLYATLDRSIRR